ncbi:MAG TPA: TetR/AcrR family transcriptional regulator [Bryobacteraceae bacterium]|nr:TetR/AcrR family transcriptional regulator [Bryobacteraceae bacterium]
MARTPSATAHKKVLDAAIQLIEERGIDGTSMDAIAQLSGVSKATVYKHWKDKETLFIDVIVSLADKPPKFDTGNVRQDLIEYLRYLFRVEKSERLMKIWPRIIGHAAANPNFGIALQQHAFQPRRAQVAEILARGAGRGEFPPEVDPNFAMDLLIGPVMHRRFAGNALSEDFPEQVVDVVLRGLIP